MPLVAHRSSAVLILGISLACSTPDVPEESRRSAIPPDRVTVERVIDDWHGAAARADEESYFAHLAVDAVFLGTDASERWTVGEFRAYAHPHFAAGRGWTYVPSERHVVFADDGRTAWFDEKLTSEKYGELRGTGVLRLAQDEWKIAHYSMTFLVPNGVTGDVVQLVRSSVAPGP